MSANRNRDLNDIDFSYIRYGQCWEDADILLSALDIQPGEHCLSIASAGDNTLSLLTADPKSVYAIDINPAQLACLALRIAAFQTLTHRQLLCLIGCNEDYSRRELYQKCYPLLDSETQQFWNSHLSTIETGIGHGGKFERYFKLFRQYILPLIHRKKLSLEILKDKTADERHDFYHRIWNNRRWRILFNLFFSRKAMGKLGRDPEFFRYVKGDVAQQILMRAEHALIDLNPYNNPYLQWIVSGNYISALPHYLRKENFELIRDRVSRISLYQTDLEGFLNNYPDKDINKYNLSDIFEYISQQEYEQLLKKIAHYSPKGSRAAYWNMLAPRQCPEYLYPSINPLDDLASKLHIEDRAFFYSRFIIEEFNV